ncbi:sensor domain-containing diguanylate cyclase [Aliikangiella sp. G2MR2-5]|uniref:sensor domain-containing diguanylate cyclase n=1 Tax=Aliikangiella sp. G2MR2-5 TaxID=2788943 RepID=UPI0018A9923E|nr:GGDEF domain-containing protein [Aliikangiella sp. G2MR2-5]
MSDKSKIEKLKTRIAELEKELNGLRSTEKIFNAIMDNAPALISAKDTQGNIILTNQQFGSLAGPAPEDYIGKNVYDLFPKEIADELWKNDCLARDSNSSIEAEENVEHKDGSMHTYFTVKFPLKRDEDIFATCAFSIDITNLKRAQEERDRDSLTGLYNRRLFYKSIIDEQKRASRSNAYLALLMLDLDHFKELNDNLGHLYGDEVLVALAKLLHTRFRRLGDYVFRIGGEEFVALLTCQNAEEAVAIAESIRTDVLDLDYVHPNNEGTGKLSISIGLKIVAPNEPIDHEEIFRQADQALYQAKTHGRNQVVSASLWDGTQEGQQQEKQLS